MRSEKLAYSLVSFEVYQKPLAALHLAREVDCEGRPSDQINDVQVLVGVRLTHQVAGQIRLQLH